jgi:DNA recombination protein RmuC
MEVLNIVFLCLLVVLSLIILIMEIISRGKGPLLDFERAIRNEISKNREEISTSLKSFNDSSINQIAKLTQINEQKLDNLRLAVEQKLKDIQEDNSSKLDLIRQTVDEKLHSTLEKRLGESFKLVSDRLEQVGRGLGEMQSLANGVGDLKKVLTNVKARGTWGEIQLEAILDQILNPDQYEKNVSVNKNSREHVEFAVKLPGKDNDPVWMPIDSKFPKEDYEKLVDAQDKADVASIAAINKSLENRIKAEAKDIHDKYISPPNTTNFAIMFLPTEGLYAEIIRRPGLCDELQRKYRVVVSGPTTIAALLNSLQMGFKTLAIEKRASEVWKVLSVVKAEFHKFGDILEKTNKQLDTVCRSIESASRKSRTIESKLKNVQELPAEDSVELIEEIDTDVS